MLKLVFFILLLPCFSFAQSYNTTGGINYNKYMGLTFKQRVANHTTVEGSVSKSRSEDYYTASILGAQHFPMLTKRFNFFMGGGLHFTKHKVFETQDEITIAGLTAMSGLDFTIRKLNISWDMQFKYNKFREFSFIEPITHISLRYVFFKRRSKIGKWFRDKKYIFWKKKK